jgi:dipeptidyl aminopeptidase/acylaminoacyl peptidase
LIRTLSEPALHPDGSRAVVAVTRPDLEADAYVGQLWTVPLASGGSASAGGSARPGGVPRRLTRGFRDTAPRFSPDGSLLAFLRAQPGGPSQLFVVAGDGGEPVQVTDRKLGVSSFRWSPDGSKLAFTSREPEQGRYGTVEGLGAAAEPPRRITTWKYAQNGVGYHLDRPQHVFLVVVPDVDGEPVVQPAPGVDGPADARPVVSDPWRLTDVPIDHGPIAFAPDGSLAVVAAVHPGNDDDLRSDVLLLTWDSPDGAQQDDTGDDTGGGAAQETVVPSVDAAELVGPDANLTVEAVEFGADGTLYLLGLDVGPGGRDFVARNTALYAVDPDRGPVRRLTDPEDLDLMGPIVATADGVLAVASVRGTQQLVRVDADGQVVELTSGDVVVSGGATSGETTVVTLADPGSYGDLAVVEPGGARRVTDFSAELRAVGVATPVELTVQGRDGYPVHGWVAVPEGDGPHPTVLMIHGGPFAAYGVGLFDETQVLTAAGYAVVYCNPRGSASYGQAHGRAIRQAMGTVDLHDVLDFLDGALDSDARLDGSRVGIMGGSYGGYLTAWAIAHDHRFAGAIVERGFLDPEVFFGTSDIGSFFGGEYVGTDGAAVAAQSPQAVAGQVTTPTLVLHSEQDLRCPLSQAERYYATLKRGGVEAELVVFPGKDHELSRSGRPRHRLQRFDVVLDWWQRKLPVVS